MLSDYSYLRLFIDEAININLLLIFIPISISILIFNLSFLVRKKIIKTREENRPFECGYDSKTFSRLPFSSRFFNLTLIFIVFDLETVFLFCIINIKDVLIPKRWRILLFYLSFILIFSIILEWNTNMLDWV